MITANEFLNKSKDYHIANDKVENMLDGRMTPHEWLGLYVVQQHPGSTLTFISEVLGVSQPRMTALTKHLEAKGYIKLKTGKDDRRSRVVKLTKKGGEVLEG